MASSLVSSRLHLAAALLGFLMIPSVAVAGDEATVGGKMTANGETVDLPYVYVYEEEKGFYDDSDKTWKLIFTDKPIAARDVDDPIWDAAYVSLGVTISSEFDDEPKLQVYSQSIRFSAEQPGNVSGGTYPEIELESQGPERFAGRVYLAEEQEIFDDTFQYDFTFSAPLSDPDAPFGEPLPSDGGEPGKAYLAWVEVLHSGDMDKLKAMVPAEFADQLEGEEAKEQLEFMRAMTPTDQKILSGSIDGATALLQVEGMMDGEPVIGEVTLEQVDGRWLATSTAW